MHVARGYHPTLSTRGKTSTHVGLREDQLVHFMVFPIQVGWNGQTS